MKIGEISLGREDKDYVRVERKINDRKYHYLNSIGGKKDERGP